MSGDLWKQLYIIAIIFNYIKPIIYLTAPPTPAPPATAPPISALPKTAPPKSE